ncbi:MAG: hypothetical protein CL940_11340 [Deltaproteobacteria bacterium]|nr:hypothetical protein [Deltaproteobacteria bacterium]
MGHSETIGRLGGRMGRWPALLVITVALAVGACSSSDDDGDACTGQFCFEEQPEIQLEPSGAVKSLIDGAMAQGESLVHTIRVLNADQGLLSLEAVILEYEVPEGAEDTEGAAFELLPLPSLPANVYTLGGDEYPQGIEVQVQYTKQGDGVQRSARITFESNDPFNSSVSVTLETVAGQPNLLVNPNEVDFGLVPKDTLGEYPITLLNTGDRTLMVSRFQVLYDGRFGVKGPDFSIGSEPGAPLNIDLPEAIAIEPGTSSPLTLTFLSETPTPAEGMLKVYSDDPDSGEEGYGVTLLSNKTGPCIQVEPRTVDFEGKVVGTVSTIDVKVTSCGTEPLSISHIGIGPDSSEDFTTSYAGLPGDLSETGPTPQSPLIVGVNEFITLPVTFVPDAVNPKDSDNLAIPDLGTLEIHSDAFESLVEVELMGAGAEIDCPTAVILVEEGEEVIPQTVLHLDGSQSYAPYGPVVKWLWEVDQPEGSQETFVPTASDSNPVFAANVVGVYTFRLRVWDENNTESCPGPAEYKVVVQPDQAIHVELTWVTEGDPDETDTGFAAGTDLDLHFTHPSATGPDLDKDGLPDPWFDKKWDCFWYNGEPDWGSFDPNANDNPSLDRDDTDGAGPENLNLAVPEDDTTYLVGAHYWQSNGFGDVEATVRIFSYASEIYTKSQALVERDMWKVATVHWPSVQVEPFTDVDTDLEHVVADYTNPFFFTP